jgi:hypothetical protein
MKKLYVLIGIAVFTLTILNVSNIDSKTSPTTLSSLFASARAGGEGPECGYNPFIEMWYSQYYDECNWVRDFDWDCMSGYNNTCTYGYEEQLMMSCHFEDNYWLNDLYCTK